MKVLIAEDDRTTRAMLAAIVARWGYVPIPAEDGGAAWSALQQPDPPRLVLLDWNMPVLSGVEVCRLMRAANPSDPPYLILLTGRADKGDVVRGLDAGANDFVAKPYDHEELQARLQVGRRMLDLQSHLLAVQAALAHQAMRDPLTGIENRRAIMERLTTEISRARRYDASLTVGMCDVDHFKAINDTYGHQAGDDVLRGLASFMQSLTRGYDGIGRYGGDEFLVIAPGATAASGDNLFERLCDGVSGTAMQTRKGAISASLTIGVAAITAKSTIDTLLADADVALYRAKEAGRGRVAYATSVPDAVRPLQVASRGRVSSELAVVCHAET